MSCERHEGFKHEEFRLKRDDLVFTGILLASGSGLVGNEPVSVTVYRDCLTGVYLLETVRGTEEISSSDAAPFPNAQILVNSLSIQGQAMAPQDGGAILKLYNDVLLYAATKDKDIADTITGGQA